MTEFDHADERIVVGAATRNPSEEKSSSSQRAKRRDVVSKLQETKNEKTSEGDDEIRRLGKNFAS